jgi:hypothetical protein
VPRRPDVERYVVAGDDVCGMADIVPRLQQEGSVVKLAGCSCFTKAMSCALFEPVAARDYEAEAAAGAREVALGDVFDRNPRIPNAFSENIKIALGGDLEA